MKIAIDARSLTKNLTGIASFLINGLNEMIVQNPEWHFYLLIQRPLNKDIERKLIKTSNVHIILKENIFSKVGTFWYLATVNNIVKEIKPDYFWATSALLPLNFPSEIKTIISVHDVVFKEYKNTMSKFNLFMHTLMYDRSINRADILWTVSHYTKSKVIEYFPKYKSREVFVGSCVDKSIYKKLEITENDKKSILDKYKLNEKFLLFVGTIEPRKNISYLLSLMPELAKDGYTLLVIGAKGWGNTYINDLINSEHFPKDKVIFADFTPPDELVKIYNIAHLYISTSLNEGFGLPQLEAMSCGCPVVTAHNSAMIEVVEGAGITVKGFNNSDWYQAIKTISENRKFYAEKCFGKSQTYNWQTIIKELSLIIK